ncbi:MAG: ECF transporter S component [Tissierellia bacterium]|nr:ECF transporter S component [Tissierellia bacterium]
MKVKNLVYYSMGIALTLLLTWTFQVPYLVKEGYLNLGDVGVFLSGLLFGPLGGMIAGALGSSLADLFAGFVIYAPFTFVIKGIEGYIVAKLNMRKKDKYVFIYCLLAGIFMVFGYFVSEWFLYGLGGALANIGGNFIQAAVCATIASLIYKSMKNTGVVDYVKKHVE